MKKILFVFTLLLSFQAIGQHTAGIKFFGLNKTATYNGSSLGVFYRLDISEKFSVQIEPSYSSTGSRIGDIYIYEYLESPELLYFTPIKGKTFFDIHTGVNLKYLLDAKRRENKFHSVAMTENNIYSTPANQTQLGLIGGASVGWKPNRVSLSASIRYNYDLTETFPGERISYVSALLFAGYSF